MEQRKRCEHREKADMDKIGRYVKQIVEKVMGQIRLIVEQCETDGLMVALESEHREVGKDSVLGIHRNATMVLKYACLQRTSVAMLHSLFAE